MSQQDYIGKVVIIGVTSIDGSGLLLERRKLAGTIISMDKRRTLVKLDGGEGEFELPADLNGLEPAEPGIHNLLNGNVESVLNPDFTCEVAFRDDHSVE